LRANGFHICEQSVAHELQAGDGAVGGILVTRSTGVLDNNRDVAQIGAVALIKPSNGN